MRRTRSTIWRAAKEAFVAVTMEGVGPGVKMEEMRSLRKFAMMDVGKTRFSLNFGKELQKVSASVCGTRKLWVRSSATASNDRQGELVDF